MLLTRTSTTGSLTIVYICFLFADCQPYFQPTLLQQATQMKVPSLGDAQVTSAAPQSKHWRFSPVLFRAASSPLSLIQEYTAVIWHAKLVRQWMTSWQPKWPGLPVFNVFLGVAVANLAPTKFAKIGIFTPTPSQNCLQNEVLNFSAILRQVCCNPESWAPWCCGVYNKQPNEFQFQGCLCHSIPSCKGTWRPRCQKSSASQHTLMLRDPAVKPTQGLSCQAVPHVKCRCNAQPVTHPRGKLLPLGPLQWMHQQIHLVHRVGRKPKVKAAWHQRR